MRGAANSGKARHAAGRGGGGALCRPMKKLTPIMLAAALGGCLDAPPDTLAPTDDPALAEPADGVIPGEGETGYAVIDGPMGRQRVAYVVKDGMALWDGDIVLGP